MTDDRVDETYADAFGEMPGVGSWAQKFQPAKTFSPAQDDPILRNNIDFSKVEPKKDNNGNEMRVVVRGNDTYMQTTLKDKNGKIIGYVNTSSHMEDGKLTSTTVNYGSNKKMTGCTVNINEGKKTTTARYGSDGKLQSFSYLYGENGKLDRIVDFDADGKVTSDSGKIASQKVGVVAGAAVATVGNAGHKNESKRVAVAPNNSGHSFLGRAQQKLLRENQTVGRDGSR